jgi:hypothetical protein
MALSNVERALAEHHQSGLEAAFAAAPAPRMVAPEVGTFLRTKRADAALARLRGEIALLNELDAEDFGLTQRIFTAERAQEALRADLESVRQGRVGQTAEARVYADQAAQRIEGQLHEIGEQVAALRVRRNAAGTRAHAIRERVRRCELFVRRSISGGVTLRIVAPADVGKLSLAAARERVAEIEADGREIDAAPPTAAEVKERVTAWLERKACKPHVAPLFDRDGVGEPFMPGHEHEGRWVPDTVGVLLWLNKDKILQELHADADRLAEPDALDAATRDKKLAENKKQKLAAERIEEQLSWAALQAGEQIVLREDADPRAILAIEVS